MSHATLKNVQSHDHRPRFNGALVLHALLITVGVCCGIAVLSQFAAHDPEFDMASQMVAVQMDEPIPVIEADVKPRFAMAHDVWLADESAKGARPDASH